MSAATAPMTRISGHPKNCRCDSGCAKRNSRYQKRRLHAIHSGTWEPLTDAGPAIETLHEYIAAGWTVRQLECCANVSRNAFRTLLGLDPGRTPPKTVRASTVAAIESLARADRLSPAVPDITLLDCTGSVRRIQALGAIGWSTRNLAARNGRTIIRAGDSTQVQAGIARAVAAVYAELWNTPGPSARAVSAARRLGFAPPMAWEGVDIDDPRSQPVGWRRTAQHRTSSELVEDAEFITRTTGVTDKHLLAERLGVRTNTLEKARERVAARAKAGTT